MTLKNLYLCICSLATGKTNNVQARDLPDSDSSWWQSSKDVSDPFARVGNAHWVSISAISKQYSPTTGSVDAGWCEDCRDEVRVRLPVPGLGGRVPAASLSQCGNNQDLNF